MTVGGFTLVVNLAATVKELAVARQFGTGDAMDALLIAFLLPSYAVNVLAGSCSTALVPTFVQVRENEGQEKAQQLLSGVIICKHCRAYRCFGPSGFDGLIYPSYPGFRF